MQEEVAHQGEDDEAGCQKRSRELTYYHGEICEDRAWCTTGRRRRRWRAAPRLGARYRLSRAAAAQARSAESGASSLHAVAGRANAGEICGGGGMVYHGGRPPYNLIE
jgi:hypothetical protein